MQGILCRGLEIMKNLCFRRPPLQIFAAPSTGRIVLNQYYSSSWKYLLYESCVWLASEDCFCAAARAQKQF